MDHPAHRTVDTDPIRGTDLERCITSQFCPWCDAELDLTSREPWRKDCPDCEYAWMPGLVE